MANVVFTEHVAKIAPNAGGRYPGEAVREVLEAVFVLHPRLRGYVLDDQGRLRKHVAIFIDGARVPGEAALTWPAREDTEVYVMQALSGG